MLHPSWALRTLTDELCAAAGFTPRVAFECDELRSRADSSMPGSGWPSSRPPSRAGHAQLAAEPLIRLTDDGAHREVGLAWSTSRRLLPSAELFREYVLDTGLRRLGSR